MTSQRRMRLHCPALIIPMMSVTSPPRLEQSHEPFSVAQGRHLMWLWIDSPRMKSCNMQQCVSWNYLLLRNQCDWRHEHSLCQGLWIDTFLQFVNLQVSTKELIQSEITFSSSSQHVWRLWMTACGVFILSGITQPCLGINILFSFFAVFTLVEAWKETCVWRVCWGSERWGGVERRRPHVSPWNGGCHCYCTLWWNLPRLNARQVSHPLQVSQWILGTCNEDN